MTAIILTPTPGHYRIIGRPVGSPQDPRLNIIPNTQGTGATIDLTGTDADTLAALLEAGIIEPAL